MLTYREHLLEAYKNLNQRKRKTEPGECQTVHEQRCTLCHAIDYTYEQELKAKNLALQIFWKKSNLPGAPDPIVPSPRERRYRNISRRKAFRVDGKVRLALTDVDESPYSAFRPLDIGRCQIETDEHTNIYDEIQKLLEKPFSFAAATALNYVVIKGSYREHSIIFSVSAYNPTVSKAVSRLSKLLIEGNDNVTAFYLFLDEGASLTALLAAENDLSKFKRLYGKKEIPELIAGKMNYLSSLAFPHYNFSTLDFVYKKVEEFLAPSRFDKLIDVYCGYGLFTIGFAERVNNVAAIDPDEIVIDLAKLNMLKMKFLNCVIAKNEVNESTLKRLCKASTGPEIVILSPPKGASTRGLVEFFAPRNVRKVVYLCHDIDMLPTELTRWQKKNFLPSKIICYDVLPGLYGIEAIVLMERKK